MSFSMKNAGIPQFNHIGTHSINKLWLMEHIIGKVPIKNAKTVFFCFFQV